MRFRLQVRLIFSQCSLDSSKLPAYPTCFACLLVGLCTFPRSYNLFYLKEKKIEKERGREWATPEGSRLLFRKLLLFQALLRGALTQQSAVILVCMAIDRYVCMLHPHRYHKHSSKRVSYFAVCHSLTIKLLTTNEFLHYYSPIDYCNNVAANYSVSNIGTFYCKSIKHLSFACNITLFKLQLFSESEKRKRIVCIRSIYLFSFPIFLS